MKAEACSENDREDATREGASSAASSKGQTPKTEEPTNASLREAERKAFQARLDVLLSVAPNLAGFLAFILERSIHAEESTNLALASFGLLFISFACFLMVTWRAFLAQSLDLLGIKENESATALGWRIILFQGCSLDACFEAYMHGLFLAGAVTFYLGLILTLWDFDNYPVWGKTVLTVGTAFFAVPAALVHLQLLDLIWSKSS